MNSTDEEQTNQLDQEAAAVLGQVAERLAAATETAKRSVHDAKDPHGRAEFELDVQTAEGLYQLIKDAAGRFRRHVYRDKILSLWVRPYPTDAAERTAWRADVGRLRDEIQQLIVDHDRLQAALTRASIGWFAATRRTGGPVSAAARDAQAKDLDPREDSHFLKKHAQRFREFAEDVARGDYSFDLAGALAEIQERADRLRPLSVITDVARRCADAAPAITPDGEEIRYVQVYRHWQLVHLVDSFDMSVLEKDASRVTVQRLKDLGGKLEGAQKAVTDLETRLSATKTHEVDPRLHEEMARAVRTFQAARTDLLTLIGAKAEVFDPGGDYDREYRHKRAQVAMASGRSVEPDGDRIRDARKSRGWTQDDLASRVCGRSKGQTMAKKTIGRMESGESRTDNTTLKAVAEVLEVNVLELVRVP